MNPIATLALAPLLLVQGSHVRRTIVRLPEPPGVREGRVGAGPPLRLLVLGDSSACAVGADSQDEGLAARLAQALGARFDVTWRCHARSGAKSVEALAELDALGGARFDVAVSVLGANDATGRTFAGAFERTQRAILARLRGRHGARCVVLSGLPPMHAFPALPQPLRAYIGARAKRLDAVLARLMAGAGDGFHFPLSIGEAPDLVATDGFHPSARAYALWAEALAARLAGDALCDPLDELRQRHRA